MSIVGLLQDHSFHVHLRQALQPGVTSHVIFEGQGNIILWQLSLTVFSGARLGRKTNSGSPRTSQSSSSPKPTAIIANGRPSSYKGPVSPVAHDTRPGIKNLIFNSEHCNAL